MAQNGLKTALIEKESLGGTCLNWGCIPTKSLISNASIIENLNSGSKYGFSFDPNSLHVDYEAAYSRSRKVVERLREGVQYLIDKNRIELFQDTAQFVDMHTIKTSKGITMYGENIVIATGSSSNELTLFNWSSSRVMNSRKALSITELPHKAVIVGAGAIGIEFAYIWSSYGSDITLIELMEEVLPTFDQSIQESARQSLLQNGIRVLTGTSVKQVTEGSNSLDLVLKNHLGEERIVCDAVLVATGNIPNTEKIGLNNIGIQLDNGYIVVDNNMQTNINNIYAIGDVTGLLPLAHIARAQGIVAADYISGKDVESIAYDNVPRCVYCVPEIASIGLTESQCEDRNMKITIGHCPFSANGKAAAIGNTNGFIKVLVNSDTGEIVGVHMFGPHVTELISQCGAIMNLEISPDELFHVIYPHPSLSEVFGEASNSTLVS